VAITVKYRCREAALATAWEIGDTLFENGYSIQEEPKIENLFIFKVEYRKEKNRRKNRYLR
jgi:hypothetical protein